MKKVLIIYIIMSCMYPNFAFADNQCDWSTIKKLPDLNYEYPITLHLCVGQLVQDSKIKDQQINDLHDAVNLKDLALTKADERTQLWQKTADDSLDRLNKIENDKKTNEWLYFGLGAALVLASGFVTAKLIGR